MLAPLKDSVSMAFVGLLLAAGQAAIAVIMIWRGALHLGQAWLAAVGRLPAAAGIVHTLVWDRGQ